ncbi:Glycolate oxidase subunit protein [Salinisphaera shabanensis E1L3A]|uniref:Glycolate oxidase subunit protein n=1 Tax=Salinisphaera shabanensis E1L3A TaxID=1033802 RepID=U2ELA8_9GAMM|nr:glycolate oxidase subunit GlcE [Salinisphaera shabanensis]ERJ18715.1 Glycolate oxidase subunit protein [Salinisphaera shabanensis E1L3A]
MKTSADQSEHLRERVAEAFAKATPLHIRGSGSKDFLGETVHADTLDVTGHTGVVNYEPGELVMTARAGTPLAEIETVLDEAHQMLAFEPPHFGENATLGGTIASGLSGPARPFTGAARDFVLGCRIVNGQGQILRFGGEVMKNVAGYDLSRLMAGSYGTLGVLLDVSLKVLPVPRTQVTQVFEHTAAQALEQISDWQLKPWPITGAYWEDGKTYLRLAGATSSVESACEKLGGDALDDDRAFWHAVREHQRPFFTTTDRPLWRVSLPPAAPMLDIDGDCVIDWGGAQRWLQSDMDAVALRRIVKEAGGHASVYRGDALPRFHPIGESIMALQKRLKKSMDPAGILNPGRIYPEL